MIKKDEKITSWSYSRYSTYNQCPRRAKYLYIDKKKEDPSPAMERGAAIHKTAENFITKGGRLPKELEKFKDEFAELRTIFQKTPSVLEVEGSWTLDKNFNRTEWNNWAKAWLRAKLDLAQRVDEKTIKILDWKTGAFKPDQNDAYLEQLSLYSLCALILHPEVETVITRLVYLDSGDVFTGTEYHRSDLEALKTLWLDKVGPMLSDRDFPARATWLCRYCSFSKDNGGDCEF